MQDATTRNSVRVTCSPQYLESFYHRELLLTGNKASACRLGLHPTTLSRDKIRFVKTAVDLVHEFGLPEGCVAAPGCEQSVVLTGEEARQLLSLLEHIREPKA